MDWIHIIEVATEVVYTMLKKYDKLKNVSDSVDGSTYPKESEEIRQMVKDASRDLMIKLYLSDEEIKTYEARRQMCWESEDPIKCKNDLDDEYVKLISTRQENKSNIPDITLGLYKASISALIYIIEKFSLLTGLPDVQCKMSEKENATWIRVPERIVCINDTVMAHQQVRKSRRRDANKNSRITNLFSQPQDHYEREEIIENFETETIDVDCSD